MSIERCKVKTIRELREERGWSQAELAYRAEVSPSTVYNWEAGRFEPKASQLRRVAQALGASMDNIEFASDEGKERAAQKLVA
jgi:transcriptional regulator with XRE-family HTH domain